MFTWLWRLPRRIWNRYKYLFVDRPCERCGGYGAGLVIDAVPAGKKIDGKRRMVTKTFTVRSCDWLCRECRRKKAEDQAGGTEGTAPAASAGPAA